MTENKTANTVADNPVIVANVHANDMMKSIVNFNVADLQHITKASSLEISADNTLESIISSYKMFKNAVQVKMEFMEPSEMNRKIRMGVVEDMTKKMVCIKNCVIACYSILSSFSLYLV